MKKSLLLVFFAAILLTACGKEHPLQDIKGHTHYLSDYHGKWVIINYWASWCRPCHQEIAELNTFAKVHKHNAIVLGVNFDQPAVAELVRQVNKMNIHFIALQTDPAPQLGIEAIPGLPTTYLIDPKGHLVIKLLGEQTQKSIENAINEHEKEH